MTEQLAHVGVKGMKWGVRKSAPKVKSEPEVMLVKQLKNGGTLTVTKDPPGAIASFIRKRASPEKLARMDKVAFFTLANEKGEKVGDAQFFQTGPDTLGLDWIGVKKAHRGNGYASAAMEGVVKYAQDKGLKQLKLEVPGNAPDARHIYEKLGFKEVGKHKGYDENDYWSGLTDMVYDVPQTQLKQADLDMNELMDYIVRALDNMPPHGGLDDTEMRLQMSNDTRAADFLIHYGVVGMKWGKRRGGIQERVDSSQLERSGNSQKIIKRKLNGKSTLEEKVFFAPDRVLMGKKRHDKFLNKKLSQLEDRDARIKAGKRNVGDMIDAYYGTTAVNLLVSRVDNKG